MKFSVSPEHLKVIGNDCTVQEIANLLDNLKSLVPDERYDVYSELFREGWATDAGYVLLPDLWESLEDVVDLIDFELANMVGSIQRSVTMDPNVGAYETVVLPCVQKRHVKKTMDLLLKGGHFCNSYIPENYHQELVTALGNYCLG